MALPKIKYQQLNFTVTTPGQQIDIDAETDKLYTTCTGINILLNNDSAKFSNIQLHINGLEILPENYEVFRILFRPNAPFGYEYHTLNEPAGGSKIKGKYIDKATGLYPYFVSFSFRLENIESTDAGKV